MLLAIGDKSVLLADDLSFSLLSLSCSGLGNSTTLSVAFILCRQTFSVEQVENFISQSGSWGG